MTEGLNRIKDGRKILSDNKRISFSIAAEYMLGSVYLQIVLGEGNKSLTLMAQNIGFIIKNLPNAAKKAENHLRRTIELSEEICSKLFLGQAYIDLGRLHRIKKRTDSARDCFLRAIKIFEQNKADVLLNQAKEEMESLN